MEFGWHSACPRGLAGILKELNVILMKQKKLYWLVNWIWVLVLISVVSPASVVQASFPVGAGVDPDWIPAPLPPFGVFSESMENGDPDQVVGVYVHGVMALPVIQQPYGSLAYVSDQPDVATQFEMGMKHDTVGLMAHNYLAGEAFFNLEEDQEIKLVYGDGRSILYRVREIQRYQAMNPNSISTEFVGLQEIAPILTANELFERTYGLEEKLLVFQTCIAKGEEDSWGRLFVLAEPVTEQ